jgi:hypothetical protein
LEEDPKNELSEEDLAKVELKKYPLEEEPKDELSGEEPRLLNVL